MDTYPWAGKIIGRPNLLTSLGKTMTQIARYTPSNLALVVRLKFIDVRESSLPLVGLIIRPERLPFLLVVALTLWRLAFLSLRFFDALVISVNVAHAYGVRKKPTRKSNRRPFVALFPALLCIFDWQYI